MNPESESNIQREILNHLGRGRFRLWRQQAGKACVIEPRYRHLVPHSWMELAPAGAADLTGIYDTGRRIEIEVKTPTGQQREAQERWQSMIRTRGGIYIVARSVDDAVRQLVDAGCPL